MMKKVLVLIFSIAVLSGCQTTGDNGAAESKNPLLVVSETMDEYVEILANDWPKASAAVREGVGLDNLPKNIADQMERIDKMYKNEDGTWKTLEERKALSEYVKWSAAFARLRHTGPVMQAVIEQYAPGLLGIPQVMRVLTFGGLGIL